MNKTFKEISKEYDFEIDRIVGIIKKQKAKRVVLQFPDGLKPYATIICDELSDMLQKVDFFIWGGSCFGGCDVPEVDEKDFDLIVQFGHSKWNYA